MYLLTRASAAEIRHSRSLGTGDLDRPPVVDSLLRVLVPIAWPGAVGTRDRHGDRWDRAVGISVIACRSPHLVLPEARTRCRRPA